MSRSLQETIVKTLQHSRKHGLTAKELARMTARSLNTVQNSLKLLREADNPLVVEAGKLHTGNGGAPAVIYALTDAGCGKKITKTVAEEREDRYGGICSLMPTTLQEVTDYLGISQNTAAAMLQNLKRQGEVFRLCYLRDKSLTLTVWATGKERDAPRSYSGLYAYAEENIQAALRGIQQGCEVTLPYPSGPRTAASRRAVRAAMRAQREAVAAAAKLPRGLANPAPKVKVVKPAPEVKSVKPAPEVKSVKPAPEVKVEVAKPAAVKKAKVNPLLQKTLDSNKFKTVWVNPITEV